MDLHHPDASVIARLGGPSKVGRLCGIRSQAVSAWKRKGIPPARRMYLEVVRPEAFVAAPIEPTQPAAMESAGA